MFLCESAPKISLATFEYGIKEFSWPASIPKKGYIGLLDTAIYEKYLTDETSETSWITKVGSTEHPDLFKLLKSRNLIQN